MEDLLERRRMLMQQSTSVDPYLLQPFTITVLSGSGNIGVESIGEPYGVEGNLSELYFNLNNNGWESLHYEQEDPESAGLWLTSDNQVFVLSQGDVLQLKGVGSWGNSTNSHFVFSHFRSGYPTLTFSISGNINSLCWGDNFVSSTSVLPFCFCALFGESSIDGIKQAVTDASNLRLPATSVGKSAYRNMFDACTSLTSAPQIGATEVGTFSMYCMFYNCVHLTNPPEKLLAINMDTSCYNQMFRNCSRMTTAPEIPNVNWGTAKNPMNGMFRGCSALSYIKAMFTELPSDRNVINGWTNGVASSGTFVKNSAATWNVSGTSGVPSGWTIQYASS